MGIPRRTPSKVMMTMNISTAANISQRCPLHTTRNYKDSLHVKDSTVSKADTRSTDNKKSNPSLILREIPTRISQLPSNAAAIDLATDDDERRPHQPPPSHFDETKTNQQRTPLRDDVDSFDYKSQLDAITDGCKRMQQQWPLLLASIDQNCAAFQARCSDRVPPPEPQPPSFEDGPSFDKSELPAPTATHESINQNCVIKGNAPSDGIQTPNPSPPQPIYTTLEHVYQQSTSILDEAKRQSQAIRNLTAKSANLLELMTQVVSEFDILFPDQSTKTAPVPHPMAIITTTAPAPDYQKPPVPTRPPNIYRSTDDYPWPTPTELFPKPAQKMKPQLHKKRAPVKPFVVRGCSGMSGKPSLPPTTMYPCTNDSPWPPTPPAPFHKPAPKLKSPVHKNQVSKPSVVRGRPGTSWTKDCLRPP